jgi:DNA polymerase III epsilon subunit family exonuclease
LAVEEIGLERPLDEVEFVAFDTETTGLMPSRERVVEVSGVRFTLGEERSQFESLVDPGMPIPPAASRVHGITDEDVSGQPSIADVLPGFMALCEGAVVVAHNAEFDVNFLAHEASRHGLRLAAVPVLDSVEIARSLRPDLPNHKLETLSTALGCPAPTYHRALADSQTLMHSLRALIAGAPGVSTLRDLLAHTSGALTFGPDERLWMWLPPELAPLEEAMASGGRVTLLYEPEGKRSETREVRPRAWMRRPGATFLVAHCERDHSDRNFRLDWITRAQYAQATLF